MQTWKAAEQGGEGDLPFQSGQRSGGNQMDRRFISSDEQKDDHAHDLVFREPVSRLFRMDQRRDQIVLRGGAALGDQSAYVAGQFRKRGKGAQEVDKRGGRAG